MAATTTVRNTEFAGLSPARGTYPVAANTLIIKGTIVCLNASGQAVPGVDGEGFHAIGKASHTLDNRTGSDLGGAAAAADVEVEFGVFGFIGSDSPATNDVVYVVDNQTVSAADPDTDRGLAGVVTEVRNGLTYVFMGPHVVGPIADARAFTTAAIAAIP